MTNARQLAAQAAAQIADRLGGGFDATVVLGTGWDDAVAELGELEKQISTTDLVGFPASRVEGHGGTVGAVAAGERRLLVYRGRVHLYEGNTAAAVTHGVRTAAAAGCGPSGAKLVSVDSAAAMKAAVLENLVESTALIMAAAVADYKPADVSQQKIKKADDDLTLPLERTADILMTVKQRRADTGYPMIVVGFAAESENLVENASDKLQRKGLDLLIANDITAEDAGFQVDANRVLVLDMDGGLHKIDRRSKADIGAYIIERIGGLLN